MTQTTCLRKSSKWVIYEESLDRRSALTCLWHTCLRDAPDVAGSPEDEVLQSKVKGSGWSAWKIERISLNMSDGSTKPGLHGAGSINRIHNVRSFLLLLKTVYIGITCGVLYNFTEYSTHELRNRLVCQLPNEMFNQVDLRRLPFGTATYVPSKVLRHQVVQQIPSKYLRSLPMMLTLPRNSMGQSIDVTTT